MSYAPFQAVIRKFDFAHDSPGLLAPGASGGFAIYTPAVGDVLVNVWLKITVPFDGATPLGDAGQQKGLASAEPPDNAGWFDNCAGPVNFDVPDATGGLGGSRSPTTQGHIGGNGHPSSGSLAWVTGWLGAGGGPGPGYRIFPCEFTTTDPVRVFCTQNGFTDGAVTGSTVGAGVLYLVTATPS